jgi:hypothetical protein
LKDFYIRSDQTYTTMPPKEEVPVVADENSDEYASAEGKG